MRKIIVLTIILLFCNGCLNSDVNEENNMKNEKNKIILKINKEILFKSIHVFGNNELKKVIFENEFNLEEDKKVCQYSYIIDTNEEIYKLKIVPEKAINTKEINIANNNKEILIEYAEIREKYITDIEKKIKEIKYIEKDNIFLSEKVSFNLENKYYIEEYEKEYVVEIITEEKNIKIKRVKLNDEFIYEIETGYFISLNEIIINYKW